MQITSETLGDLTIFTLIGRVDPVAAEEVEKQFHAAIASGCHKLLIDLTGVSYITSPGLAVFLLAWNRLREANGSFNLCAPSEYVKKVFEITGFYRRMPVFTTRDDAVAKLMTS